MERQLSFAQAEYAGKKKTTRRDKFLAEMEAVVPWARLVALIAPHYPKGVERMLCVYFLQQRYGLADEALADTIYDSQAMRGFVGVDLNAAGVPDATTRLHFRHLLERHELTRGLLDEVNAHLTERGLLLRAGTLVDATIIAAPSSTKNRARARDPEMHQTKQGNQWYFGMKAHLGADADSGLVPHVVGTAANASDLSQTHALLHGEEQAAYAAAGYTGVEKRAEIVAQHPQMQGRVAQGRVALKRGKVKCDRLGVSGIDAQGGRDGGAARGSNPSALTGRSRLLESSAACSERLSARRWDIGAGEARQAFPFHRRQV